MKIWIVNQYASTPETGMGGRHYYLARELAEQGHEIFLIASSFTHLLQKPLHFDGDFLNQEISEKFHFIWMNLPKYSGAHDKKRVFNWLKFSWKLLKLPQYIGNKPDVILYSSPSLIPFLGVKHLANKLNARLVFEVRDIWPLTLVELGGYSAKHPFIRFMQWIEDLAYQDSDKVVSNLSNAVEHMVKRGMDADKFNFIANGFDLNEVQSPQDLSEDTRNLIPKNKFIIGYVGTIGISNALSVLIDAAFLCQEEKDVVFVLVGEGKEKKEIQKKSKSLLNVVFIDAVPKRQISSVLELFDICFLSQAPSVLYKYGVASRKLPEYLIASKPIIHATKHDSLVGKINAGVCIQPLDPVEIFEAIMSLKKLTPEERIKMGENGRKYALDNYNYSKLAKKLAKVLN
jgi:glycosyltransferase involved in cell wall biosynthesis